jgi:hypothetical protein
MAFRGHAFVLLAVLAAADQLGSSARDQDHGIVVDGNDDIIAIGEFSNTGTIGTTTLNATGTRTDIYVVKFASTTGNVAHPF